MKFTVKRSAASAAIKKCLAVTNGRMTLPILSCIQISATDGEVVMTATDLDRWIVCRVPAEVSKPGSHCLSGKLLSGIFSSGDEATVEVDSKLKAAINCGGSKFRFSALKGDEMPEVPSVASKGGLTMTADAWLESSKAVAWAASNDPGRYALNGTLLEQDGETVSFVATDGNRLSKTEVECTGTLAESIIIPTSTMAMLNIIADNAGDLAITVSENMLKAECGGDLLFSKLVIANYPNYKSVIPRWENEGTTKVKIPVKAFTEKLDQISLLTTDNSPSVRLGISPGTLAMSSGDDAGDASSSLEVEVDGHSLEIAFSSILLGHPFRRWSADEIEMETLDEKSPGLLRSGSSLYLILPRFAKKP